ncbi:MAG: DNA repair exonuclease [Firmicutes bacterium]|jgi:DNA repair exonuclease SbcCD nuclease subunit|nr:DNA repair exonuclease [Bacillota bacterium]MDH7496539.1 DNA repair exonuclease [Bacillota bacterium]
MLRCLHLADLHLGWSPSDLPDDKAGARRQERDLLLKRAVDFALEPANRIGMVIIAGDLFESHRPDPAVVEEAVRQLERLVRAGVFLLTVPGNHDEITYHDSVFRRLGGSWPGVLVRNPMPELVASESVKGVPVHVYSLAYTGGLTRVSELATLPSAQGPGVNIGVFHCSLGWGTSDRSLPIPPGALEAAGYTYAALGHVHRHERARLGGRGLAVYPGMVEAKGFDDPGTGELTVVDFTDTGTGWTASVKTSHVPARKYVSVEIEASASRSYDELVDACRVEAGADQDALVRIELKGVPPFAVDADALARSLSREYFFVEVVDDTSFFNAGVGSLYASEPTIRGHFVKRLMARLEQAREEREKRVLELALRKGLAAFGAGEGGDER